MRKRLLWIITAAALATPVVTVGLRAREQRSAGVHFSRGLALLDAPLDQLDGPTAQQLDSARTELDAARRGDGELTQRARGASLLAQGFTDLARGDFALAAQQAEGAASLLGTDPRPQLLLAMVAHRRGDRAQVERLLEPLLDHPASPLPELVRGRAQLLRIELLLDTARAHRALTEAEQLAREQPGQWRALNALGLARGAVGDVQGARDCFERAQRAAPRTAAPMVNLARLDREEGSLATARTTLERALAVDGDSSEAWLAYGVVLAELAAPEARHALVRAAELAPDDASAWVAQGNLDLTEEQFTQAVESFHQALRRDPDSATARTNLAVSLARLGRNREASEAFLEATRRAPHQGEAWNGLGALRLALGDAEHAVGPLQQAATLLPHDVNPVLNLGLALEALERWDDAVHAFRQALERSPQNVTATTHMLRIMPEPARSREARRLGLVATR